MLYVCRICFQRLCRRIFLNDWENSYTGLLSNAPADVSHQLADLLQDCINLEHHHSDVHVRTQMVFDGLYDILTRSMKSCSS